MSFRWIIRLRPKRGKKKSESSRQLGLIEVLTSIGKLSSLKTVLIYQTKTTKTVEKGTPMWITKLKSIEPAKLQ